MRTVPILKSFREEGFIGSVVTKIYVNCSGPHKLQSRTAHFILVRLKNATWTTKSITYVIQVSHLFSYINMILQVLPSWTSSAGCLKYLFPKQKTRNV